MEKDRWSEKKKGERGGEEGMVEAERTERERAGEIRREQENDGKERETTRLLHLPPPHLKSTSDHPLEQTTFLYF